MAREIGRLSPVKVQRIVKAGKRGMWGDGAGLWLHIGPTAGASWLYRFMMNRHARSMGLGPIHTIGLAEARNRARAARQLVLDGIDPIERRDADLAAKRLEAAKHITFRECAKQFIAGNRAGWKNAKHGTQWENTLATYAYPVLGHLAVASINRPLVVRVLQPIWTSKTETAARVRQRIEAVLDFARVLGYRDGENPAAWAGNLEHVLPAPADVKKKKHHPALPYADVPAFLRQLRQLDAISARALEFLILTATRTNEVIFASPDEIEGNVWTIPEGRMKGEREHRVPLSERAVEIVDEMKRDHPGPYLFPGGKRGKPLSNMAMLKLMRGMKRDGKHWTDKEGRVAVPHGCRSSFRDWCSDRSTFPREIAEMALSHVVGDETERAYARSDLFEKRCLLMDAWATFCNTTESGTVTALRRTK